MEDEFVNMDIENQCDPIPGSWIMSGCSLRSYQADAMRNIFDAVVMGKGGRFAVTFPRQSGKNEMQAQLETAVMAANQHRGGNIIKIIPTEKNQGKVSTERLAGVLRRQFSECRVQSAVVRLQTSDFRHQRVVNKD